jgi:hypothetical protein
MPAPFVNYEYMRTMVEETMLSTAQRLAYVSDVDVFGGEDQSYVPSETFPCGFKPILVSEQPSFTGTSLNYDAKIRLPHRVFNILHPRDRIRVTIDDSTKDYEIVGLVETSRFTVLLETSQVQVRVAE